mmetsp:Transcript_4163/g.6867  ORF Transcript_4163/g.6867 Transcript_4163/m.6867 type:complete len:103 (-) Transcript_4163:184-492(-)
MHEAVTWLSRRPLHTSAMRPSHQDSKKTTSSVHPGGNHHGTHTLHLEGRKGMKEAALTERAMHHAGTSIGLTVTVVLEAGEAGEVEANRLVQHRLRHLSKWS